MSLLYLDFLNQIDNQFSLFQKTYYAVIDDDIENGLLLKDLLYEWYHEDIRESPLISIMDSIVDFEERGAFVSEIKSCLLSNHIGAIEFTKVILERQYAFIQKECSSTLNYYLNNIDESYILLENMFSANDNLTDQEILTAVKIHFIEAFITLEEEFYLGYPLYSKSIITENLPIPNSYIPEYIRLAYAEENHKDVIEMIYNILIQGYIEPITLGDFALYFTSNRPLRKIQWLKNDILLLILFEGKLISLREGPKELSINVINRPLKLICDVFLNKNGQNFVRRNLDRNKKNLNSASNQGAEEIEGLLIDVYKRFIKNSRT
ncbi:hypothetical protein [Mucilaginibacter sp.]|uniref:hypothetical protein n=1 Tax=Mucilaginibacter sp. TaxID=1882438 RepID=UPI00261C03B1|nr:hypothetical protein [Mucilaginibacter sp.]MDB5129405.1 hypothetical protein [Mucilaginibacter sp.]